MARRSRRKNHCSAPVADEEQQAVARLSLHGEDGCRAIQPHEISEWLQKEGALIWVDIQDPGPHELEMLRQEFGFHRLALEDAGKQQQRPKVDEYKGYYFVVMYAPLPFSPEGETQTVEVDMFVGRNYVVSLHQGEVPALQEAGKRWERTDGELREHVGFLLHTVMDSVIDAYFPVVDELEDRLDDQELKLYAAYAQSSQVKPENLLSVKRSLFTLRRAIYPMREIFNTFLNREQTFFDPETYPYFQDVYDHVLRLLDIIDIQRDMATGTLDAHLAVVSNRLNETMKGLTVVTVVVAIMGAVFGAWGMNFTSVPFDKWGLAGFYLISGTTVTLVAGALAWMKYKRYW